MAHPTGPKIVVIEDNPSISTMLETVLVSVGYQVVVAATARDGLERVQKEFPAAVILDLHLPDSHGGGVLRAIRADKATSTLPVIVLTASEKIDDVLKARSFGASDYMTKPFDARTLLAKISRHAKAPAG